MTTRFIFADEAGCFTFKRTQGASRYFILCTLTTDDCSICNDLLDLRRTLVLEGDSKRDKLHATTDAQAIRDNVFVALGAHRFRFDATILEKAKAPPHVRTSDADFYRFAWRHHFKALGQDLLTDDDKLLITAASIGTKKTKATFKLALNNALQETTLRQNWESSFLDSAMDPMLWAADYCAWAIQRKWERDDDRSYRLIAERIVSEVDVWNADQISYY
jgi:hypothetical protein